MINKKIFISIFIFLIFLNIVTSESIDQNPQTSFGDPIIKGDYKISRSIISRNIGVGDIFTDIITITNLKNNDLSANLLFNGEAESIIEIESPNVIIESNSKKDIYFTITGKKIGNYKGKLIIGGDIKEELSIEINVEEETDKINLFLIDIILPSDKLNKNKPIDFNIYIHRLLPEAPNNISLKYNLEGIDNNLSYTLSEEDINIKNSLSLLKSFELPQNITSGNYILRVNVNYLNLTTSSTALLSIKQPLYDYKVFGKIPLRLILYILCGLTLILITYLFIKRRIEKSKKYQIKVDIKKLPKTGPRSAYMGKVAETNVKTYFDLEQVTTHVIIAGATGGGKSYGAQILCEEALVKGVSVIVFDPTAQWSGMLRKCTEKKILDLYPKYGMNKNDAHGFNGNVKPINNAREIIDLKKYIKPGEIQVFTINKLDPQDIDIFMANTINQIFKANLEESNELKVIMFYDEVHRLLSRFGGSGEGFIQIERACREFRKWGIGVILISQVLSDFVGEIKANISTEIQVRTRDEGDLTRIKNKYGDNILKSLVKASVGTVMVENPSYNNGNPYFITYRPCYHNLRRLSDEELDKYTKYNEIIDDLEYQIEQLEKEKVDVFDLKLELKLALDKIKTGNFNMVDIYLEGLKPRIKSQWDKIGKQPKKKEIKLISEEELKASIEKAKEARKKYEEEHKSEPKGKEEEKKEMIKPLTFDNGMMISSLQELKNVLETLDNEIFKIHVNNEKNDISNWVENDVKNIELANKLKTAKTKEEMFKILEEKEKKEEEEEEKKKQEKEKKEKEEREKLIKKEGT